MLEPSGETLKIRKIVDHLSDDELRSKGPLDFRQAVEAVGLSYSDVRANVNNELARARRQRGIRKGRGRRVSGPDDPVHLQTIHLLRQLDQLGKQFPSWELMLYAVRDVYMFTKAFGGEKGFLELLKTKVAEEKSRAASKNKKGKK